MILAFACVQLDTGLEIFQLQLFRFRVTVVTREEGGSRKTVTNGDKGEGGLKNRDFYSDILFEWPLSVENFCRKSILSG